VTDSSVPRAASDPAVGSTCGSAAEPPDRFAEAPISRLVGFQVQPPETPCVSPGAGPADQNRIPLGYAVVLLECSRHHHNPMGRVHGGLIAALADSAMGIAFGRTLLEGEDFSTIDMQISFIRPMKTGRIRAEAKVIERGLRIGFVRCEITNTRGKLVAVANCTCTLIRDTQ
jgi:uncharacterized protein (TIGR00369 family)